MATEKTSECLTLGQVEQWVNGKLDDLIVDRHVKSCPHCQAEVRNAREDNELFQQFAGADLKMPESGSDRSPNVRSSTDELAPTQAMSRANAHSGRMIGRYKLLQKIGEGGFGEVWMAEQSEPVVRRVAVKIIKLGMDTKQVIARFEAERQALAMMDHPSIARVLDAGTTDNGRPYFVMELVRGLPITTYCDKEKQPIRDRLELFRSVCSAVQHAHQKGVIHRDLKPNNILVTVADGRPLARVIDFGIAKAIHFRLTNKTLFTEFRQLIGTPEYMSPEQADPGGIDIDTRSDIYALGVLLYELLTGVTPLDAERLRSAAIAELQRIIHEEEPKSPSTRLSTLATLDTSAANRGVEAKRLPTLLRGELDWIVMKCLEKDRNRRYDTANSLSEDVKRHLEGELVSAGPPSRAYRLRRLARRHRRTLATVCLLFLALSAGLAGTMYGLLRAQAERDEASAARDEAEAVTQFMSNILASADPAMLGKDVTVRTALDKAAPLIKQSFIDKPLVEARLHLKIGWTYRQLGLFESAQVHFAQAETIYIRELGPKETRTLEASNAYSTLLHDRGRFSDAETRERSQLEIRCREMGADHPDTLLPRNIFANSLHSHGRYAEAEKHYLANLEILRNVRGKEDTMTLMTMNNLASSIRHQGRYTYAEELYRSTLEIRLRILGPEHPDTLATLNNLACCLSDQGRFPEAEVMCQDTLESRRRTLGKEHPEALASSNNLAASLSHQGRFAEAEKLCRENLESQRQVLGEKHPDVAETLYVLATVLEKTQRWAEAEPHCREAESILASELPPEHRSRRLNTNLLGGILSGLGRFSEAEPRLIESYKVLCNDPGLPLHDKRDMIDRLIRLYDSWDAAEPEKANAEKAAHWRAKLEELDAPLPSSHEDAPTEE